MPGPGVQKATASIRERIAAGELKPGDQLPGRDELARIVGVSARTVSCAIAELKSEGVLQGVRGQRTMVPTAHPSGETAASPAPQRGFRMVVERLKDDILGSVFVPGSQLPQIKELQRRYDVSYRTVDKALSELHRTGVLASQGCRFAVPPLSPARARSTRILFLFYSDQPLLPSRESDRGFIRALEQECARNNVGLDCGVISETQRGVEVRHHEDITPPFTRVPGHCAGIVYLVNWSESTNPAVLSWLAHSGRPVSVIDWLGNADLPGQSPARPPVQIVRSRVSRRAGLAVGQYLRELGHRHIAAFSSYHDYSAREQVEGLREAFSLHGSEQATSVFAVDEPISGEKFLERANRRFDAVREIMDVKHPGIPSEYLIGAGALGRQSWDIYEDAEQFAMLAPHFGKVIKRTEITAWVGCNDSVALMAGSFLRARGKRIPHDIALMGFDNTFAALEQDLTSYDFNFPGMAAAALNFLLRPSWRSRIGNLAHPRIEGTIIQRGSTARAIA